MVCEVCGKSADMHHIIHRYEGGLDFEFNLKPLCSTHHRGKSGPHRNKVTDLRYKLELQEKLYSTLDKSFYTLKDLILILKLSNNCSKKLKQKLTIHKEGYEKEDVILFLMCGRKYSSELIEDFILEKALLNI